VEKTNLEKSIQYCRFKVGNSYFGIDVLDIQEVIKELVLTDVPKSRPEICGLMNLRGNIVTQISLRKLFNIKGEEPEDHRNIIIQSPDGLLALKVDEVDDVYSLDTSSYEKTPDSLPADIKLYADGVHKLESNLLIVLNLEHIRNPEAKVS
jgi:purine-binding chemotaxis protein CheW